MDQEVSEAWESACADAGFDPQEDAVFLAMPSTPPGGESEAWAVWHEPGQQITFGPTSPLEPRLLTEVNRPPVVGKPRVLAFTKIDPRLLLGYLRHELEHVRQFEENKPAHYFSPFIQKAIVSRFGRIPGSGRLYNMLPRESDANSAAAQLIGRRVRESDPLRAGMHESLFRAGAAPDPSSLFFRSVCFASLLPDDVHEALAEVAFSLDRFLGDVNPQFIDAWDVLMRDEGLSALRATALATVPDVREAEAALPRAGDAWSAAVDAFERTYRRALTVLEWPA